MSAGPGLQELIETARALLDHERQLLREGRIAELGEAVAQKAQLLAAFDAAMPGARATAELHASLDALVAESRRNEELIAAALKGVAAARRQIEAIAATRSGRVAYAVDGSPITSRADAAGRPVSL